MTQEFTGVLAVLHRRTVDGRQLDEPGPELNRPYPLTLRLVHDSSRVVGFVHRVWRDGDLIRYSGALFPGAGETASAIRRGELVGMLDADRLTRMETRYQGETVPDTELNGIPLDADADDVTTVLHGWRVTGVTLLPPGGKAWPEVSLTLGDPTEER